MNEILAIAAVLVTLFGIWLGYKQWQKGALKPDLEACHQKMAEAQRLIVTDDISNMKAINLIHDARDIARKSLPKKIIRQVQSYLDKAAAYGSKYSRLRNDSKMSDDVREKYAQEIETTLNELQQENIFAIFEGYKIQK